MADQARFRIITVEEESERITFRIEGEIVYHNQDRVGELIEREMLGKRHVVLDFSGIDYIDSAGVALLVRMSRDLRDSDRRLTVTKLSGLVDSIFNLLSLRSVIDVV